MINAQLTKQLNDPERFVLVKIYQVHAYLRTCRKYDKNASFMVDILLRRHLLQNN